MPKAYHGLPLKVDAEYTHYEGGVKRRTIYLGRQDLMRVAGAIAKSKDEKTGGIKWSNGELLAYIKNNEPWESLDDNPSPPPPDNKPKGGDLDPEDAPNPNDRIATEVTCECGHTYTYRIKAGRYESTKKWLEGKPCPPCARNRGDVPVPTPGQPKEDDQPEDAPEEDTPEAPTPDLDGLDLDKLADALVDKVMKRLDPIKMPEFHHEALPEVVKLLQADVPVWLKGPPGTSKSTLAEQAATALGMALHAMSCHEGMTRSDLFGYTDANGVDHRSPLWDAFEHGGVLLLDEIDNGNSNILAALNSALSNGHCTFAGKTVKKHDDFKVVATANTAGLGPEAGFIGRMGVDLATLDRFVELPINIDNKLEGALVKAIHPEGHAQVIKTVRALRKAVQAKGLRVVVSPRTSLHAAKMVKVGVPLAEALKRTALKGVDDATVSSLLADCKVVV